MKQKIQKQKIQKQKILKLLIVVLFIAGMIIFFYPLAAEYISQQESERYITSFEQISQAIRMESDELAELGLDSEITQVLFHDMQAYNRSIYENGQEGLILDPFSYETPAFNLSDYGLSENMVGYIQIPRMDIKLPIYLGATNENLALGAANLGYTSLPIGGENTNTVLAAHRGYKGSPMFRSIEALQIGDRIYITNFWETLIYEVTEIRIILPSDLKLIYIQEGKDMVTLITCHPYTKNYQRYLVYAERIEGSDADVTSNEAGDEGKADTDTGLKLTDIFKWGEMSSSQRLLFIEKWTPAAFILLIILCIIIWRIITFKKRRGIRRE